MRAWFLVTVTREFIVLCDNNDETCNDGFNFSFCLSIESLVNCTCGLANTGICHANVGVTMLISTKKCETMDLEGSEDGAIMISDQEHYAGDCT